MKKAVLLYDSDCGFCRWSIDKILAWDRQGRLRALALQDPEADELLAPMGAEAKMGSWHLVTGDGRVHSAGAAAAPLFRLLPGGRPLAAVFAASPQVTQAAYELVARNRDRFGQLIGQAACRVDPTRRNERRRH